MINPLTKDQAKKLLKDNDIEISQYAESAGVGAHSVYKIWNGGLSEQESIRVQYYVLMQSPALADKQYLSLMQQAYERRDTAPIREALAIISNELEVEK